MSARRQLAASWWRARQLAAWWRLLVLLAWDDMRRPSAPHTRAPLVLSFVPLFVILMAAASTWYAFGGQPYGWRGPWLIAGWAWAAAAFAALGWSR